MISLNTNNYFELEVVSVKLRSTSGLNEPSWIYLCLSGSPKLANYFVHLMLTDPVENPCIGIYLPLLSGKRVKNNSNDELIDDYSSGVQPDSYQNKLQ